MDLKGLYTDMKVIRFELIQSYFKSSYEIEIRLSRRLQITKSIHDLKLHSIINPGF